MLILLQFRVSASKNSNLTFVTCIQNQNYLETLFVPVLFKCLLVLFDKEKKKITISDLKLLINISYITHQYTLLPNTLKLSIIYDNYVKACESMCEEVCESV